MRDTILLINLYFNHNIPTWCFKGISSAKNMEIVGEQWRVLGNFILSQVLKCRVPEKLFTKIWNVQKQKLNAQKKINQQSLLVGTLKFEKNKYN